MNDFEIKSAYEKQCIDSGIPYVALRAAFKSEGLDLRGLVNSKTEEDFRGIDALATVTNKTFEVFAFRTDYKFRAKGEDGRIYDDVLINLLSKNGKYGWALDPDKKTDVVSYINVPARKVCLLYKEDMLDAKNQLKSHWSRRREKDNQINVILEYEECKKLLPNFVGPIDF